MRKIINKEFKIIETIQDLLDAIKHYKQLSRGKGSLVFFDTETTGLNIKYDLPFLLPWGYLNPEQDTAYIYCVDRDADKSVFDQTACAIVALAKDVAFKYI